MKRDFITILALMMALSSCNDDALFEKEMYKNVVALISSDYYNTFEEVVTLSPTGEEATGYIAACTGGTHAPKQDMVIGLEEDLTSLEFYNRSLYDVDEACYAKFLSSDKYEIVDYKIQINAGERTGRTMIKIRPEGLSPDSTYFVGLKATDNFKLGVVAATFGVFVIYVADLLLSFFGLYIPFINDNSVYGIAFSLFVVVLAAFNLVLDFDFIENGVSNKCPKYMEWYGAFGVLVTLVWLYIEILKLLAKIRSKD